jgi:hypothetical protein
MAFAIVCLAAIGLTLVVCRHAEVSAQHEIHQLQARLVAQRRQLWALDVTMGRLTSLQALEARSEDMHTRLLQPHQRVEEGWDEMFAGGSPADPAVGSWSADRRSYGGAQ